MEEKSNEKSDEVKKMESNKKNSQNKTLRNVIIVVIFLGVFFLIVYYFINSVREFEYSGITGNVVREGNLIFYQISIPVTYKGEKVPYNFYLRNDPRKLDNVPFNGRIEFLKNVAIKGEGDFNCNGEGIIAIANLARLYEVLGADVINDETAECDTQGRYMLIKIKEGEKTEIEQVGLACYEIRINNCEILKGTERFMVETFIEFDKIKDNVDVVIS